MDFLIEMSKNTPSSCDLLEISNMKERARKVREKIIESRIDRKIVTTSKKIIMNKTKNVYSSSDKDCNIRWEEIIHINIESSNLGSFGGMFSANDINIE